MTTRLSNLNIIDMDVLVTPTQLKAELPLPDSARQTVSAGRQTIKNIMDRKDKRFLLIVGPCSLHDPKAALDYARRLKVLADELSEHLYIVMRVYFEKPRTSIGWKGLINDPHLNDSFDIQSGLRLARKLLMDINELGLPCATEALDPIIPQYLQDCISWSAIGARTAESQTHREMASGLSMPVGFKNSTDGSVKVAINAIQSVANPHSFLGVNQSGQVAVVRTRGNGYGHLVLRGGASGPNYDSVNVTKARQLMTEPGVQPNIVVDCSHANSHKDPANQPLVLQNVVQQKLQGESALIGAMLESNLHWGKQSIPDDPSELQYGVSVTDACIDWPATKKALEQTAASLAQL